jgi:steroid 5-alpha reductase family enzyme
MTDWKRMIVGDAFRVTSRDPNYYRDLLLFWPFWAFTVAGTTNLFSGHHDHRAGLLFIALGLLSLMFARERFFLVAVGLGFCAAQDCYLLA